MNISMIDWDKLSEPPEIAGDAAKLIGIAQADWYLGYLSYSNFLMNLDLIFDCLVEEE